MVADIKSLTGALATAGAGSRPMFVCSFAQAATMKAALGAKFDIPILAAAPGAVAAGTIILLDADSFASGFSPVPEFSVSDQASSCRGANARIMADLHQRTADGSALQLGHARQRTHSSHQQRKLVTVNAARCNRSLGRGDAGRVRSSRSPTLAR